MDIDPVMEPHGVQRGTGSMNFTFFTVLSVVECGNMGTGC